MIRHPSDMMINDTIHHHGDTMEIKPLISADRMTEAWRWGVKGKRNNVCAVYCSGKRKEKAGKGANLRWWE